MFFSFITHKKKNNERENELYESKEIARVFFKNIKWLKYCCRQHPQVKLSDPSCMEEEKQRLLQIKSKHLFAVLGAVFTGLFSFIL